MNSMKTKKDAFLEFLENNARPVDNEKIDNLTRENAELQIANNKLQQELIEIIKR